MLERSFYSHLQTINDRSFNVHDSNTPVAVDLETLKVNNQEIGQCFIKRVDDSRLILTVAPSVVEDNSNLTSEHSSEDNLQSFGRSRANTWHYTKRNVDQSSSTLSAQHQENSNHYYRTMSVGSKPCSSDDADLSWAQHRVERNFSSLDTKDAQNTRASDASSDLHDFPPILCIEVYDCRQDDVENVLMSNNISVDHTGANNNVDNSSGSSTATSSDEDEDEKGNRSLSSKKKNVFDQPGMNDLCSLISFRI